MPRKKYKKNQKRKIRFFIILLICILIILFIALNKLKSNKEEDIFNRLIAGLDNLNYTYTLDNGETTVQVFGRYEKKSNHKSIEYSDYNKKISNTIYLNSTHRVDLKNKGNEDMLYYSQWIQPLFNSSYYTYKYKGKEKYNGQKCLVVDFMNKDDPSGKKYGVTIWINDSLNIIEKAEYYFYNGNTKEVYDTQELNYHTNVNKLDDVKVPDSVFTEYSTRTN